MNQITRTAPAQRAMHCPTKHSVNLAKRPPRTRSAVTLVLGVVLIAVLALAVAKFAVLDQLARHRAAEQQYQSVHAQYVEMQNALESYDAVEQEYRTYSRSWMTEENGSFVDVDRMDVLALVEQELMARGEVRSLAAQQNTLVVHMAGMSLAEVSAMLESVQRQPIVAGASLNLASTADEDGLLEFSVTVVLQSAGEGEG